VLLIRLSWDCRRPWGRRRLACSISGPSQGPLQSQEQCALCAHVCGLMLTQRLCCHHTACSLYHPLLRCSHRVGHSPAGSATLSNVFRVPGLQAVSGVCATQSLYPGLSFSAFCIPAGSATLSNVFRVPRLQATLTGTPPLLNQPPTQSLTVDYVTPSARLRWVRPVGHISWSNLLVKHV
jgi:hypothetical protein